MNDDMMIAKLTLQEKLAFLKCFIYVIRSDGKIEDSEKELIVDLLEIYELHSEYLDYINHESPVNEIINEVKAAVKDRPTALFLIKELLAIANIDNDIADGEISFIEAIAKSLEIEDNKIVALNDLIIQRMMWLFNYKIIMEA